MIRNKLSECNLVEFKETKSLESENAKITGENNGDCNFCARDIINHEFDAEK
jgi:hypothetical protein